MHHLSLMQLNKLSYKMRISRVSKLRSSCGFVMGLSLPKQKNEWTIWHSRVPPRYNCYLIFLDDDSFRASRLSKHQSCSQMLSAARAATISHMEQVQYSVEINRTDKGKNIYAIPLIFDIRKSAHSLHRLRSALGTAPLYYYIIISEPYQQYWSCGQDVTISARCCLYAELW